MGILRLPHRWRLRKAIAVVVLLPLLAGFLLYVVLLSAEYLSARQASRMLDKLDTIRLGDPAERFEDAVQGCEIKRQHAEFSCELVAGAFRFHPPWALMGKLSLQHSYDLGRFLDRTGLRAWRLYTTASITEGHISKLTAGILVEGRYETLGGNWQLAPGVPTEYLWPGSGGDERRTLIRWFHITSLLSGEGLTVDATPGSTAHELRARSINRQCLFTFRGCDGLCEVLPDAVHVLRERGMGPGGRTNVPRAACDDK